MTSSTSSTQARCNCGLLVVVKISKTAKNPGRLFMRCSRWRTEADCGFFQWIQDNIDHGAVDQEEPCRDGHEMGLIIERQREMIKKLLDENGKHTQVSKFNLLCLMCAIVLG